ncbi:maleylpyruvate isomerase N-terminal domain-containing protein [soil metagenome]
MQIEPDTKDWTWVLSRPCPECGFNAAVIKPQEIGDRVRRDLDRWVGVLERVDPQQRPDALRWSPAEYACHVRDVFDIFTERLALVLDNDDPLFPNWDQDATAIEQAYALQDPTVVAVQLVRAGERAAQAFDDVPDDAWDRHCRRSDGSRFTTASLGSYFLHDVVHHLYDVRG